MKIAKLLVTVVLLLLVAAGAVYLVVDTARQESAAEDSGATAAMVEEAPVPTATAATETAPSRKVVAYYFHGTKRCKTCRRIEAYTEEAIRTAYGDEIRGGRLEWKVLNIEEPANEHFVQDFDLAMSSVVLSDVRDGERQRWKNLDRIWHLTGNKAEFMDYIREETAAYLEEEHG